MKQIGRSRWFWAWDQGVLAFGLRSMTESVEVMVPMIRLRYLRKVEPAPAPLPIEEDQWVSPEPPADDPWPVVEKPTAVWRVQVVFYEGGPDGAVPPVFFCWGPEPALTSCGGWLAWVDADGTRHRTDTTYMADVSWSPKE